MEPKELILNALQNSLQPDAQKLKQATEVLTKMRQEKGYCLALMQIVDNPNISTNLKQGALVQLKNTIKTRWNSKKELAAQDKQAIKGAIVTAICRCGQDIKLIKIYRQVLTIIVGHQYKNWLPLNQITQRLKNSQDISATLHCLLAISSSFQYSITDQQREDFFKIMKLILPVLKDCVEKNQSAQIIYLSIKFLWKGVHYDIDQQVKVLTMQWMPLLVNIVGMTNEVFESNKKILEHQNKNTAEFFYFHSKKWSTRIILRFYQKHAKVVQSAYTKKSKNNPDFTKAWYESYGLKLAQIIYKQLNVPTAPKVRYFQMKCIHALVNEKPDAIEPIAENLQYNVLVPYLTLKQEDQELANNDPLEFLNKQLQPSMNFTNLKRVATDIWVAIAQMGSKCDKNGKNYQPSKFFYINMNYLRNQLEKGSQLQKQLAMYLICQLRTVVVKCTQVKDMMPQLISTYVIPQFKNKEMFLRARAVDIFYEYGSMGFPLTVLQVATEGIYLCLTQDKHALVQIKAASAFNCILRHKHAKDLVKPLLRDILGVYLKLLETYDLESLVNSLQSIVQDFNTEIQPFAYELVKYLLKLFSKLFTKDVEQANNEEYTGETELAAAGCLKTVTQIIDSPISVQVIQKMQPQIVQLCFFVFTSSGVDYIEDLLVLMNSYIYKCNEVGPNLWFFYQVIIYNITGIPKQLWAGIQSSPLSQQQKQALKSVKGGGNIEMMESSTLVLRNYIRKGSNVLMNNADAFKTNLLQLLFLLIAQIYKKGPGQYTGEIQMTCGSSLLINFLQNNLALPEPVILHVWQLAKFNMLKLKSRNMKAINCQLIAMLIYRGGNLFVSLVNNDNMMQSMIKQMLDHESKLTEEYEFQRMILGLNVLITISERPQALMDKFSQIFKLLIKLVEKNTDYRIKQAQRQKKKTGTTGGTDVVTNTIDGETGDDQDQNYQDDQNTDIEAMLMGDDQDQDDQDFWQELHDQNYDSALDDTDEIKQFEDAMKKIQTQQSNLYANMIQLLDQKQMVNLDAKIQRSVQAFLQLREKQTETSTQNSGNMHS